MLSPSVLNRTAVPRSWRICFLVRLIMPWRLRDWAYLTFPLPVTLKRFLAPDLVLILGIWLSFSSDWHAAGRPVVSGCDVCTIPRPRQPLAGRRKGGVMAE